MLRASHHGVLRNRPSRSPLAMGLRGGRRSSAGLRLRSVLSARQGAATIEHTVLVCCIAIGCIYAIQEHGEALATTAEYCACRISRVSEPAELCELDPMAETEGDRASTGTIVPYEEFAATQAAVSESVPPVSAENKSKPTGIWEDEYDTIATQYARAMFGRLSEDETFFAPRTEDGEADGEVHVASAENVLTDSATVAPETTAANSSDAAAGSSSDGPTASDYWHKRIETLRASRQWLMHALTGYGPTLGDVLDVYELVVRTWPRSLIRESQAFGSAIRRGEALEFLANDRMFRPGEYLTIVQSGMSTRLQNFRRIWVDRLLGTKQLVGIALQNFRRILVDQLLGTKRLVGNALQGLDWIRDLNSDLDFRLWEMELLRPGDQKAKDALKARLERLRLRELGNVVVREQHIPSGYAPQACFDGSLARVLRPECQGTATSADELAVIAGPICIGATVATYAVLGPIVAWDIGPTVASVPAVCLGGFHWLEQEEPRFEDQGYRPLPY